MQKLNLKASLTFEKEDLQASAAGGTNPQPAKFRLVANAGGRMRFDEDEEIIIDLQGVKPKCESGVFPVFMSHDWEKGVGHASNLRAVEGELIAEGIVSRETKYASDFVSSARAGFPWQASVGGYIEDSITIGENESIEVNGKKEKGPCRVATKFILYEVSIVEYGADDQTSAVLTATAKKELDMAEQKVVEQAVVAVDETNAIEASVQKLREAELAEVKRVSEIKARATENDAELMAKAIQAGWTPDQFELESLRASRGSAPAIHKQAENVDAKALEVAFVRAAGLDVDEKRYSDAQLTASDKIREADFRDVVEAYCGYQPTSDARKDPKEWVRGAFSTANLSSILSTNANAILLQAFNYADQSWRKVFKVGSVNDFKTAERWRLDSDFAFKETPATGEFEDGELSDEKFEIKANTYGRKYTLPYQSIVNGDALGVFGDMMKRIAFGASEAINQACWSLFMNPGTLADGNAFYYADRGSKKFSSALTLDNLSAARAAFFSKKRGKGASSDSPLGIPPTLLVVPTALEDKALMLTKATLLNNGSTESTPSDFNPNFNRFQVVAVPFLEYSSYTNYSSSTWYLLANPQTLAAFEVAFLFGKDAPTVRKGDVEIGRLGIAFDGQLHFGVSRQDYRGILQCVTAAS